MTKFARLAVLGVGCIAWCVSSLTTGEAHADESHFLHYQYVSLDEALLPQFDIFDPVALTNSGRVYGTAFACTETCVQSVVVVQHGTMTVVGDAAWPTRPTTAGPSAAVW